MTNVETIVRMLERAGVRWVFGIPSGPVLPLIEALGRSPVEFVLTANETSAGFMATTVGQLTGVPGACAATVGPGATNLTTGVGCAWLDCAPALAITCNVPSPWLQRRIQMRIDHNALFRPLTKATFALRADDVGERMAEALALATAELPGPVHLDLPEDVGTASSAAEAPAPVVSPALADVADEARAALSAALVRSRRPLVMTGLTFTRSDAADSLLRLIEEHRLPFVSTLHAKGCLPESHPHWGGVIGRARRTDVQRLLDRADLIVALGYDPIEINYEEWVRETPVFHLSTMPAEVDPRVRFVFNRGGNLDQALRRLEDLPPVANDWTAEELADHRSRLDRELRPDDSGFAAHHVLDALRAALPRDGILAYDVGAHTHQIATQWRTDLPKTLLATNGWSSMGFGMPAAYAARMVHPERAVVGVVGDGCFQMTAGELALARRRNLAVPIIVLNDGWLGLMKVKQERREFPLSGVELGSRVDSPPHYFGVPCRGAENLEELKAAIQWGLDLDGPSVIEAFIDVEPYSATVFD
ncbi:MAG: thiamine pyrophosphate-binding protein [Deltaproteobacteria bacterium]|nr:thiamine pyrophosphate-binding protein [Deltaproteobacteria bacterium]